MAIIIGSQLSFAQLNPNIDKRFGPYESIEAAYEALGPDGDDCISAGLVFGITESDDSITYYMWTKTGTAGSPATVSDCVRINQDNIVHFGGIVDDIVSVSGVVGRDSVSPSSVVYLSKYKMFAYLAGSSYIINWANRHLWSSIDLVPRKDVFFFNESDSSIYCYDGSKLGSVTFPDPENLVLSVNSKTGAVVINVPTKLSELEYDLELTKEDVGLGNVDNTPDSEKDVKSAEEDGEGNNIAQTYITKNSVKQLSFNVKTAFDALYNILGIAEYSEDETSLKSALRDAIDEIYDYSQDYLTFEAIEDGTFTFTMGAKLSVSSVPYMSYSTDDGQTWVKTDNVDSQEVVVTTPTINAGKKVLWKSEAVQFTDNPDSYPGSNIGYSNFSSTNPFNVSGNVMSLIYGDDFVGKISLKELITTGYGAGSLSYTFKNAKVVSARYLILPATTLAQSCYNGMFQGCTSLTTAPELPATTLGEDCYSFMFYGCTSLTAAPELPATTLAQACYVNIFCGCTSLTTAPELPATTLGEQCYQGMFYGCTSLTTAPELPATTLTTYCYRNMFQGCIGLTTAPELPATTLAEQCYVGMFSGCTGLTTAPELPATTLTQQCYQSMFSGCTGLTTAPELPATTLISGCYEYMFYGCTSLNHIKAMFTTTPSTTYTNNWVYSVASSGTFVKNSAATWNITGKYGVPEGWTVEIYTVTPPTITINESGVVMSADSGCSIYYTTDGSTPTTSSTLYTETLALPLVATNYKAIAVDTYGIVSEVQESSVPYELLPLAFEAIEDGTFTFTMDAQLPVSAVPYISYSIDNGQTWVKTDNVDSQEVVVTTPTISAGEKVLWKSEAVQFTNNSDPYPGSNIGYSNFSSTNPFNVSGNVMSLIYGDDFVGKISLKELITTGYSAGSLSYAFKNAKVVSARYLILPATTLTARCYQQMFMDCTSLTTAPELPATTLANDCYNGMFMGCTSLTTAPELPATTLAQRCYQSMFQGCTSLNYIKAMFTTTPSVTYTSDWVSGVILSGTFVKNSAATWDVTGINGVPSGWTVETADA